MFHHEPKPISLKVNYFNQSYLKYFDFKNLKSELFYMYSTPDFHLKSMNCLKNLILNDYYVEVFEVIQLLCPKPSSSTSVEQSLEVAKLKRVAYPLCPSYDLKKSNVKFEKL